jgi:NADH dehydrogenase
MGRLIVNADLSVLGFTDIFCIGDQAAFTLQDGKTLPGLAPIAIQQGRHLAEVLKDDQLRLPRRGFVYVDKGQLATIGRGKAVGEVGNFKFSGSFAWIVWLVIHIYYLIGFKNRVFVLLQWAWSYLTFRPGARLILSRTWQSNKTTDL